MLSVILIWIIIILITAALGLILSVPVKRVLGFEYKNLMPLLLMGLAAVTVYAEIFSLFHGVGALALGTLAGILIVALVLLRQDVIPVWKSIIFKITKSKIMIVFGVVLFFFMAYGTSHGYMHYDTALYHAQSIHWIEEYGIVPGLGNLHTRLGYNSGAFPLTALFSFAWMGGQSFHVCAGFCALLLAWECMGIQKNISQRTVTMSLFTRVMAIYYLFMIYDEMVSPASDYYMVCLAFILVIRWTDYAEEKVEEIAPYAMLTLLACLILTIKLSGAMLVLCVILPGFYYIKNKDWKALGTCTGVGTIIIVPYLVRNVIISGWLLYPSTAFNWFNVDWKIPQGTAEYDYKEIQVYGRGFTDVSRYAEPITSWFGPWFKAQSALDRLFILAAIVGVVLFVVKCLYYGFSLGRHKKLVCSGRIWVMEAVVSICVLFWLFTSPLFRYGCLFVYLTDALIWGEIVCRLSRNRYVRLLIATVLCLFFIYKTGMLVKEILHGFRSECMLVQQDYDEYEVSTYELNGNTIYEPVEGDQTGYYCFPSSPWEMDIEIRGGSLKSGFKAK